MMGENGRYVCEGPVVVKVKTGGSEIDCSRYLVSVTTHCEFSKMAFAEIVLSDGGLADEDFKVGDSDSFQIGKEIEILVGYEDASDTIFRGTVIKHGIRLDNNSSHMVVTAKHDAFRMAVNRKLRNFENQTDSDVISNICGEYGIDCDADASEVSHEKLVQYNCNDWDFINLRAEANGMFLFTSLDGISVKAPDLSAEPVVEISNGFSLIRVQAEMDGRNAFESFDASAWNFSSQEMEEDSCKGGDSDFGQGDVDSKALSSLLGNGNFSLRRMTNQENPDAMAAWMKATGMRNDLSRIVGKLSIVGYAPIQPGDMVKLSNLGKSFDGVTIVSSVEQVITDRGWVTNLCIGVDDLPFADRFTDISTRPADGLLPNTNGLQTAKVEGLEGDPLGEERILVKLMGSDDTKIWARIAVMDGGNGRGSVFLPEIGDEVVVGFINDDPTQAVVLGMLHSSSAPSPYEKSDDNNIKGYVSREKIKIEIDDDKKAVTIGTPGGNILTVSDDSKGISITDQNGNSIVMDDKGITVESKKALSIKAAQDLSLEGMNLNGKANSQLKMEGTAGAELSASGNTVIKGGIVQIN